MSYNTLILTLRKQNFVGIQNHYSHKYVNISCKKSCYYPNGNNQSTSINFNHKFPSYLLSRLILDQMTMLLTILLSFLLNYIDFLYHFPTKISSYYASLFCQSFCHTYAILSLQFHFQFRTIMLPEKICQKVLRLIFY